MKRTYFKQKKFLVLAVSVLLILAALSAGVAMASRANHTVVTMGDSTSNWPTSRNPKPDLRPVPWVTLLPDNPGSPENWHHNITATYFEAGSAPGPDDDSITNAASYWYDDWGKHMGGIDDGSLDLRRSGKDNLYYFALPCREYEETIAGETASGDVTTAVKLSPWYVPGGYQGYGSSWFKNQWIEVVAGENHIFAQWADAGPLKQNALSDCEYVFGRNDERPRMESTGDNNSALDLSPTAFQKLGVDLDQGVVQVSWRFVVNPSDVPAGQWLSNVTTSPPDWG